MEGARRIAVVECAETEMQFLHVKQQIGPDKMHQTKYTTKRIQPEELDKASQRIREDGPGKTSQERRTRETRCMLPHRSVNVWHNL